MRLVHQRCIIDRLVDQAPVLGLLRADLFAQHHHPGGAGAADGAGQQPGRAAIGNQADVDEGLQEIGALGRQHEIARQRDRAADARRRAVDRSHHRHRRAHDLRDQRVVMVLQRRMAAALLLDRAGFTACGKVSARAEALARTGDQHRARIAQIVERRAQFVRQRDRGGVQPLGPVERDLEHIGPRVRSGWFRNQPCQLPLKSRHPELVSGPFLIRRAVGQERSAFVSHRA